MDIDLLGRTDNSIETIVLGSGQKIIPTPRYRDNHQDRLPACGSSQPVDIILPNAIRGCRKKNL
jgi:hypothetical protein